MYNGAESVYCRGCKTCILVDHKDCPLYPASKTWVNIATRPRGCHLRKDLRVVLVAQRTHLPVQCTYNRHLLDTPCAAKQTRGKRGATSFEQGGAFLQRSISTGLTKPNHLWCTSQKQNRDTLGQAVAPGSKPKPTPRTT